MEKRVPCCLIATCTWTTSEPVVFMLGCFRSIPAREQCCSEFILLLPPGGTSTRPSSFPVSLLHGENRSYLDFEGLAGSGMKGTRKKERVTGADWGPGRGTIPLAFNESFKILMRVDKNQAGKVLGFG